MISSETLLSPTRAAAIEGKSNSQPVSVGRDAIRFSHKFSRTCSHALCVLATGALAVAAAPASGELLSNASFELGNFVNQGGGYEALAPGSTDITEFKARVAQ